METVEKKVSKEVLQQPEEISVGGKTYTFYPPSVATLILASEAISQLPQVKLETEHLAEDSLYAARECRILGDIVAILLLGARHLTEVQKVVRTQEKRLFWGLLKYKRAREEEVTVDRKAELAKTLLEELTPRDLHNLTAQLLQRMQLADFFGLTTFLIEINLTRPTREVVEN